ncbi:hypothetical protein PGT21_012394 [Puccinia graminis f. sp. tritici]|uniref:Uncharacterized protein n=1 Tax=Puccinia graminis f. sp. tritici TaxID=56615 RepID=A0A5B0NBR6_PUCGR|nr:hypothetical protein PGTUg99_006818 [Puccinia graminis f. sp. tritici]KAA1118997.1 hypothetical protein PGT21_012394 [Puccinia graminis f. sp. tritici]
MLSLKNQDRKYGEDVGAFVLQCADEVLECFDENYDELFNTWYVLTNRLDTKHMLTEEKAKKTFKINGACLFKLIKVLFHVRTKYLLEWSKDDRRTIKEMLTRPKLSPKFYELLEKIDNISMKSFPKDRQVGSEEYKRKIEHLSTQFSLVFVAHVFRGLEWPIPEERNISLSDPSPAMRQIFGRVAQVITWELYHRSGRNA